MGSLFKGLPEGGQSVQRGTCSKVLQAFSLFNCKFIAAVTFHHELRILLLLKRDSRTGLSVLHKPSSDFYGALSNSKIKLRLPLVIYKDEIA